MDELDNHLLAALRDDARTSVSDLARKLQVARSTVQARIERLQRNGCIAGFTLRTGPALAASRLAATALLQVEPRAASAVLQRLRTLPQVERVRSCSGRFDLIVELAAATPAELDGALDQIGDVAGVRSSESLIHLASKIERSALQ